MTEEAKELEILVKPGAFNPATMDRITLNLLMHFEQSGSQPVSSTVVTSRTMNASEEEVYNRKLKVAGDKVVPLDSGWLAELPVAAVLLHNYRQPPNVNPTKEQVLEERTAFLRVCLSKGGKNGMLVFPGSFLLISPEDVGSVYLTSPSGKPLTIQTTIIPGE